MNPIVSNPNDFKVVTFHNSTDFGFTPDMGCMYDGRPINGKNGSPGIDAGESLTLPYYIGHRLAENLAKIAMLRMAPEVDKSGIPTGVPLWDSVKLMNMKSSYITELYSEQKPIAMSETDKLMAKVEELKKFVQENIPAKNLSATPSIETLIDLGPVNPVQGKYQDKAEVIAELNKRGIKFDARSNKANLEKLLQPTA